MGIGSSSNKKKSPSPSSDLTVDETNTTNIVDKPLTKVFRDEAYWALPQACTKILNTKGIQIGSMIGQGYWSTVYNACSFGESEPCSKIVKLVPLYPILRRRDILDAENYLYGRTQALEYGDKNLVSEQLARYDRRRDLKLQRDQVDKQFEEQNPQIFEHYISLTRQERKLNFNWEHALTKKASELGVGPAVHEAFVCDNVLRVPEYGSLLSLGFIVMDRWDVTLEDYLEEGGGKLSNDLYEKLKGLVAILHENGISHYDLHEGNIVLKLDSEGVPIDIALIDFGNSIMKERNNEEAFLEAVNFDLEDLDALGKLFTNSS